LRWHLTPDSLVLTTNTERYPQPQEDRLHIDALTDSSLTLSAPAGYLVGSYRRLPNGQPVPDACHRRGD
jgi:hypothetical protein